MILNNKISIKNYKCFDSSGGGFEKILPINLIIGKNNSGKSSLIELIRFIVEKKKEIIEGGRDNFKPEIIIEHKLTEQEISRVFPSNTNGGGIPGRTFFEYGKQFIGKTYTYKLEEQGKKSFVQINAEFVNEARKLIDQLSGVIQEPLLGKIFCNIAAERDIVPEETNADIVLTPNGSGATNAIQQIINRTNRDSRLIENELLNELNSIINPDIVFYKNSCPIKR
ncbi:MAG: AAA family ATPase [Saprospiraceae bacterium]|nr:AAA family ATPase [Saprospiraceae bacterium]